MPTKKLFGVVLATLVALLLIAPLCIAEPDSVNMSPYMVTFDLGVPTSSYEVSVSRPVKSETLAGDSSTDYVFEISDKWTDAHYFTVGVYVKSYDSQDVLTPDSLLVILESTLRDMGGENIQSAIRTIDGRDGCVASCDVGDFTFYAAQYVISTYPCTYVVIASTYPWDEGTLSLIKTIHVEGP